MQRRARQTVKHERSRSFPGKHTPDGEHALLQARQRPSHLPPRDDDCPTVHRWPGAIVQAEGQPALLCRIRELGAGGARIAGAVGAAGDTVQVSPPDRDPLLMTGTVVWSAAGETGLAWDSGDLRTRTNLIEVLQAEDDERTEARSEAHPASCRCGQRRRAQQPLLLLGRSTERPVVSRGCASAAAPWARPPASYPPRILRGCATAAAREGRRSPCRRRASSARQTARAAA